MSPMAAVQGHAPSGFVVESVVPSRATQAVANTMTFRLSMGMTMARSMIWTSKARNKK